MSRGHPSSVAFVSHLDETCEESQLPPAATAEDHDELTPVDSPLPLRSIPSSAGLAVLQGQGRSSLRATDAVAELMAPPEGHPFVAHVKSVRRALRAAGLPTSCEGVRIFVPDGPGHGDSVVRAIAGVGLARGAQVRFWHMLGTGDAAHDARVVALTSEQKEREERFHRADAALDRGELTLREAVAVGADVQELTVHQLRNELGRALAEADRGEPVTSMLNISWGMSIADAAEDLAARTLYAPPGSLLVREATRMFGHAVTEDCVPHLARVFAAGIAAQLAEPSRSWELSLARAALEGELLVARRAGILVVSSSTSRASDALRDHKAWTLDVNEGVRGLVWVGAPAPAALREDEITAPMHASMSRVLVPALPVPVVGDPSGAEHATGQRRPEDGSAHHFAGPYATAVGALMIRAHPRIKPAHVEYILERSSHQPIPGGPSLLDAVRAVRWAASLANRAALRKRDVPAAVGGLHRASTRP